jgi:hypothetical protein
VRSATRYLHECALNGQALAVADAERDFAVQHVERFIPRVVVGWGTAAFGSCLEKDLLAAGLRCRGQHRDVLTDDVEWLRAVLARNDEWLCGHGPYPFMRV